MYLVITLVFPQGLRGAESLSFPGARRITQTAEIPVCQPETYCLCWGGCEWGALATNAPPCACVQLQWAEQVHWWKHFHGSGRQ